MANTVEEYNQWLASAPGNVAVIEMMNVQHSSWGDFRIAKWGRDIDVREEDGNVQTYGAGFFAFSKPAAQDNLEQSTQIAVSAVDGAFYQIIKDMSIAERVEPMIFTHRMVRADSVTGGVYDNILVNPPPIWSAAEVTASPEAVIATIRADPLRVRRIGLYYTEREFPVLTYV